MYLRCIKYCLQVFFQVYCSAISHKEKPSQLQSMHVVTTPRNEVWLFCLQPKCHRNSIVLYVNVACTTYPCQQRFTQVQVKYIVYAQWKPPKIDPKQNRQNTRSSQPFILTHFVGKPLRQIRQQGVQYIQSRFKLNMEKSIGCI